MLAARPEITFTVHTHSRSGAAVSCLAEGILPLSQHANMVLPAVCYHDYQDVTRAEDECAALARDLGDKYLMVMKNHGLLACGRSVGECFYWLYYLEMACKIQMDVLASGRKPALVSDAIVGGLYQRQRDAGERAWRRPGLALDDPHAGPQGIGFPKLKRRRALTRRYSAPPRRAVACRDRIEALTDGRIWHIR